MILTCPECATRFAVGDDKLRPDGRKVKCGRCAHIWFQPPPETDSRYDYDQDPIPVTPLAPEEQSPYRPANLPAMREPDHPGQAGAAWLAVVVLVVAIAALAWFGRAPIVRAWPDAEAAYLAAGLSVFPEPGEGLAIDFNARKDDAKLVLRGQVANESDEERIVPTLYVVVTDTGKNQLYVRGFTVQPARLGPGESVPFTSEVAPVPEGAASVSILFTNPVENP